MECFKCHVKCKTFAIGNNKYCAPCQSDELYKTVQDMHIDLLNPKSNPCGPNCSQSKCRVAVQRLLNLKN